MQLVAKLLLAGEYAIDHGRHGVAEKPGVVSKLLQSVDHALLRALAPLVVAGREHVTHVRDEILPGADLVFELGHARLEFGDPDPVR